MESRTSVMMKYLESNFWSLSQDKEYITLDGKKYRLLNRNIHDFRNECIASVGSNDREIILLDPTSPLLRLTYHLLTATISDSESIEAILKKAMIFVRKIFSDHHYEKIQDISKKNSLFFCKGNQVVFLDAFIESGAGVCRHHSLLLCYLIDCLVQDNLLVRCTVTHHREMIRQKDGSIVHAWVVLQLLSRSELIYHLDCMWFDKPFLFQHDQKNDPILGKYGSEIEKKYKIRYPVRTSYRISHDKLTSGKFTVHSNDFFSCELTTDDNLKFVYQKNKFLGKGSFGEVWAMSSSWSPPIVVKKFFLKQTYPATSTKEEIADSIRQYLDNAKHEAEYNKLISGLGQVYEFNSTACFNTQLKMNLNGVQVQQLLQPLPSIYIVIKKENGIASSSYTIRSAKHFIQFCVGAILALRKFHGKNIVHCDIHAGNVLVEEKFSTDVVVNYIDMTLSGYEDSELLIKNFDICFNIKPPEYKNTSSIKRKKNQDIYCLGLLFKNKYSSRHFPKDLQPMVETLFSDMMAETPGDRLDCHQVFLQLKKIQGRVFHCLTALEKLKISNPCFLAKFPEINVTKFLSLWDENPQLQLNALQFLFESKLAFLQVSSNHNSIESMNQRFYCEHVLKKITCYTAFTTVSEVVASYNKLQDSFLQPGLGVKRYLESVVTYDSFCSRLEKLNEREQLYLLENADSTVLRNLVNSKNILKVINVTDHPALLFKKLGEEYVMRMVQDVAEFYLPGLREIVDHLPDDERSRIIFALVKYKIAQSTFKKAVKFFDELSEHVSLYKEILLSFNAIYYIECSELKNTRLSVKFFRHSQKERLNASDALASGKMTPEDWKSYEGLFSHGGLGEVAKRLRTLG